MSFTVAFRRCVFRERGAALDQPVADPPYGEKVDGIRRVVFDFLPYAANEHGNRVEAERVRFVPKVLVDLLLAENIPQARGEQVQYLEFLGGKANVLAMFLYEVLARFQH